MANSFAFAELRAGSPRKVAFEAVTAARAAADATGGGEVHALVLGGPGASAAVSGTVRPPMHARMRSWPPSPAAVIAPRPER